jgi:hypothetical protein
MVPAGEAGAHITALRAAGMSATAIAAASGVLRTHLARIENGEFARVQSVTAEMILAVTAEPSWVPSIVLARRIEALNTLGYSDRDQGRYLGVSCIDNLRRWPRCTAATADAVKAMYEDLWLTEATGRFAGRTRSVAARKGYAPPEAWTDSTIDDPSAKPWRGVGGAHGEADARDFEIRVERLCDGRPVLGSTVAERREAVRILNGRGMSDRLIGERIGLEPRNVLRIRTDLGLPAAARTAGAA